MNYTITDLIEKTKEAYERIKSYIRETEVEYSPYLSEIGECNVYLKLENHQLTGSFKIRGALNKMLLLSTKTDIITASSGNHGIAVAKALSMTKRTGTIYLPKTTTKIKIEALERYNVEIVYYGKDCQETEIFARKIAKRENKEYISPYNDIDVISGQGTIGVELNNQLNEIDVLLASIGGGGLITGIAAYLKVKNPNIKIIGCLPENSPIMSESIRKGRIIKMDSKPTLSDGTAGGIEPNAITFDLCRNLVDEFLLVNEHEIAGAIRLMIEKHHMIIEGAAGVTIASFLKKEKEFEGKNVILVICGGNIGINQLKSVICESN